MVPKLIIAMQNNVTICQSTQNAFAQTEQTKLASQNKKTAIIMIVVSASILQYVSNKKGARRLLTKDDKSIFRTNRVK